jgi:hypothetical protein
MLRISVQPNSDSIAIILEGRVAGPWAEELSRTWAEVEPTIGTRKISLDLCNTTYADVAGISILRRIYGITAAQIVTSSPWTQYLAEEITRVNAIKNEEEL